MSDPLTFDSATPRLALPLLFVGQAQKEVFVNEALALVDGLLHCAVEAVLNTPPAAPVDGQAWLVGTSPTGAWSGRAGHLAMRQGGNWIFVPPRDGMRVLDRSTGQDRRYRDEWRAPVVPAAPTGGATIDAEARTAIAGIIASLREAGVLPQP